MNSLHEEQETRSLSWKMDLPPFLLITQQHVNSLWEWLLDVFLQDC